MNRACTVRTLSILLGLILIVPIACSRGGGGRGGNPYNLGFTMLPLSGTLVKSPFSVEVTVMDKKTGTPVAPSTPIDITLQQASGTGTLSGTLTLTASGPTLMFTGLSYDAVDGLAIRAKGAKSTEALSASILFEVDIQANTTDLGSVYPGDPIPGATFTLYDGLGIPYNSNGTLDWILENLGTMQIVRSGTVPFGGSISATVNLSALSVEDPYRLTANLLGSMNQATVALRISSLDLVFNTLSASGTLVNTPFSVEVGVTDLQSGLPVTPSPALDITLQKTSGSGTLIGTLMQTTSGPTATFSGLSYDAIDSLEIQATSVRTPSVTSPPIPFEVDIQATPTDLGLVYPGDPVPSADFDLLDGLGSPYNSTGDLDWSLVNVTTSMVVQTGTVPFGGTSSAQVTVAAVVTEDPYLIVGNHAGSANQATVALRISSLDLTFNMLPPSGTLVNSPFSVEVGIVDLKSGLPVTPNPSLDVTIERASGSGNLTGTLNQTISTSSGTFTGLNYDAFDSLEIRALSIRTPTVTSPPIPFGLDIQSNPTNLGTIAPLATIPPVDFTIVDGQGAPFPVTGTLDWLVQNLNTLGVVETGSEVLSGTALATVNMSPISVQDPYRLTGNLAGSVNQATTDFTISTLTIQNQPGPFVALKSARVGQNYMDDVSFAVAGATNWGLLSGTIPSGITLNGTTGVLSGIPTAPANAEFTLYGETSPGVATPIRCALAVFSQAETEWVAGQSFVNAGPETVTTTADMFTFTTTFDPPFAMYTTGIIIYHPTLASITSPLPLFVMHRGRGFHYLDYDLVLTRIAEYGFIVVSVEDCDSFFSPSCTPANFNYDFFRPELGMESGSAFHEAVLNHMIARSQTVGDPFENKIDETKTFVGGHSRGGGSTHGSHVRGLDIQINGVIYFMAYDLRNFGNTAPPGVAPAYPIPDVQPRLPSLMIMAENDGDLSYPVADELIERASGQSTSVTVYGANHNQLGDTNPPDGFPYITRPQQHDIIVNQVVAFLKRWGELDLSLEGFLYGNEHAGSTEVGVASLRNHVESLLIDDWQDPTAAMNVLGGTNSFTGGTRIEVSIYPPAGFLGPLGIQQNILTFNATSATYATTLGGATDLAGRKRLVFRSGQTSLTGYDWVTFEVRLTDSTAQTATLTLFDRMAPSTTYLPDFVPADPRVYDRFVEVQVALTDFTAINPSLNLGAITTVELLFDFAIVPGPTEQIYLDDLRFE